MGDEGSTDGAHVAPEYLVENEDDRVAEQNESINIINENNINALMEQRELNQCLIHENANLIEENAKLVEENLLLQEELQRMKYTNTKLTLQLDKLDMKFAMLSPRAEMMRMSSQASLHDENVVSPTSSQRKLSTLPDQGSRRGSFGSHVSPFRPLAVDTERGLMGGIGRWSSKDLLSLAPKPQQKSQVRGLVLRVGHLLHPVPDLDAFADFLEKQGFTTRDSLAGLTDDLSAEFGIPSKLASALREEVTTKRLKQRYTGPVQPLQEIDQPYGQVQPLHACETTPLARHHLNSKEPKSRVCQQVLRVGHRLHAPWELEKYARILEDNAYETRESLMSLTDDAAMRMRVPLKLAAALREKATQDTLQPNPTLSRSITYAGALGERPAAGPTRQRSRPMPAAVRKASPGLPSSASSPQMAIMNSSQQQYNGPQQFNQSFMPQQLRPQGMMPQGLMQAAPQQQSLVPYQNQSPRMPPQAAHMPAAAWPSPRNSVRNPRSPRAEMGMGYRQ